VSYWIKVYSRAELGFPALDRASGKESSARFKEIPLSARFRISSPKAPSRRRRRRRSKVAARVGARYTRARARARSACVYIADDCGGTRPESCLAPVNNAGRGNGAISAHLLLNVRFAALPPSNSRSPPRHPPPAFPARIHLCAFATQPSRPGSAACYGPGCCHPDCSLLGGLRAVAGVGRSRDPRHNSSFRAASLVDEVVLLGLRIFRLGCAPSWLPFLKTGCAPTTLGAQLDVELVRCEGGTLVESSSKLEICQRERAVDDHVRFAERS